MPRLVLLLLGQQKPAFLSLLVLSISLFPLVERTGLAQGIISTSPGGGGGPFINTNIFHWPETPGSLEPVTLTNDNFSQSTVIESLSITYRGDLINATHEPGEPNHADAVGLGSRWFSWTAPSNGVFRVELNHGLFSIGEPRYLIGVYTGNTVDTLTPVQEAISYYHGLSTKVTAGTVYHVALDSMLPSATATTLLFSFSPYPSNDDFKNRTVVSDDSPYCYTDLSTASKEPGEPDHSGEPGGASVWWTWTPPVDGLVDILTPIDYSESELLSVYTGSNLEALTLVAQKQNSRYIGGPFPSFGPLSSCVKFTAHAGQAYNIAIDCVSNALPLRAPTFACMYLSFTPFPTNDNFASRTSLIGNSISVSGSTLLATEEPGEPRSDTNTTPGSVWYSWTAPFTGYASLRSAQDSYLDLNVYTGSSLADLLFVAESARGNYITFPVEEGTEYLISARLFRKAVAFTSSGEGYVDQSGPFAFTLSKAPIAISDPLPNAVYLGPTNIPVTAFLDPSNTNVQWVSFYNGLNFLYEADAPPYGFSWNDVLPGDYTLSAISIGATTDVSSPVNIRVYPSNDHFTNRTQLIGTNLSFPASVALGTTEPGEPLIDNVSAGKTCWWTWTAPRNGTLVLSASGEYFTPLLSIYTGNSLQSLVRIAANNDSLCGYGYCQLQTRNKISLPVIAGQTYHISVDSYLEQSLIISGGPQLVHPAFPFTMGLQMQQPPPNDNFEKRISVTGTAIKVRGSNLGASAQPNEPAHAGITQGCSVWYSWKAPISGSVSLSTNSSVIKTNLAFPPNHFPVPWPPFPIILPSSTQPPDYPVFAVYTGSSLSRLTNVSSGPVVRFDAVAGQTYQIAIDGNQADPANLQFYLNEVPPAANDDFYRAPSISGDTQVAGSNLGATVQPGEPRSNAGDTSGHSIWWTWRASKPGICSINLSQSDDWFSPVTVYVGNSPSALKSVGSGRGFTSFIAIPGIPYHICVGSDQGYTGNIRMNIHQYPLTINGTPVVIGVTGPHPTR